MSVKDELSTALLLKFTLWLSIVTCLVQPQLTIRLIDGVDQAVVVPIASALGRPPCP